MNPLEQLMKVAQYMHPELKDYIYTGESYENTGPLRDPIISLRFRRRDNEYQFMTTRPYGKSLDAMVPVWRKLGAIPTIELAAYGQYNCYFPQFVGETNALRNCIFDATLEATANYIELMEAPNDLKKT